MVVDEKWLHSEPMPPKESHRAWVDPGGGGDRPEQARRIISDKKFHIIVRISFRGDYYFEVLQHGETVNAHRYVDFLQRLQQRRHRGVLTIMHDNARPHTAVMTENFLRENNITRIPQPPYSPDMNLSDRFIFRNMETARSFTTFHTDDEVKNFLENVLRNQRQSSLNNELLRFREDLVAI
jgi:hypothetical protein